MDKRKLVSLVVNKVNQYYTANTEAGMGRENVKLDCWTLALKLSGLTYYTKDGKIIVSDRSHVILIPKNCEHGWYCEKRGSVALICFECDMEADEIMSFKLKDSAEFLRVFRNMEVARLLRPEVYEMEWRKGMYEILLLILSEEIAPIFIPGKQRGKIQPAIDYIANNYQTNITNDILSRECGISTVYFRKIFTEVFGVSPRIYVMQFRLDIAKGLLKKGKYPKIEDVAMHVGYSDVYQFSKMFKKHTGVSPKKYSRIFYVD